MLLGHNVTLALKRAYYGERGEPFSVAGHELRFVPGTRPTRLRYATSANLVNRYDALQTRLLAERLRPGDFAVDVGGHVGDVALVMAACVGAAGRVITFEPDPFSRAMLERNIALNPGVKPPVIEAAAVSDRAGVATFFSDGGHSNSSLQQSAAGNPAAAKPIEVPVVTLDEHLPDTPAWVKIDIEGAEIAALRGARRVLDSPANMLVELHPYAWPAFGDTFEELQGLVAAAGRRMRYLDQDHELAGEPAYGTVLLERA